MIRLFILVALGVVIGLLVVKLFSKKNGDDGFDGELVDAETDARRPSLLPILLLGTVLAGLVLFVLPRFGINVMGLLQKGLALLPLLRGFLPF
jgi:hypothetical protein